MKILYLAAILLLLSACDKTPKIELEVKAPGLNSGVVILKQANEQALSQNIKNGEMDAILQLAAPGYYSMTILDNDKPLNTNPAYDVYLEPGKYIIETDAAHLETYPKVTTSSAIQNQLADYYNYANGRSAALDHTIDSLKSFLASAKATAMPARKRSIMYADTRAVQKKRRELDLEMLKAYTDKHPDSKIGAHLMAQQYYAENATAYNAVFQKFTEDVKTTDDGLKIGNKLRTLLSVMTNAKAPDIVGDMPDGKPFNKAIIKNKITLVEFWRSAHAISKIQHQKMLKGIILNESDRQKFGILSVSIDTLADNWINAIKQDHISWPQVSDLKGDNSPNVSNWNITKLPTFFLVDQNWHIIKSNIDFIDIDTEVHEYLKKH